MNNIKWTDEEKEYLMSLALDSNMSTQEVVEMLNEKFKNKRTVPAVSVQKHQILKQHGLTNKYVKRIRPEYNKKKEVEIMNDKTEKIVPKKKPLLGRQRNARRGWTTADERTLVAEWTAGDKKQREVADKLGRSVKACSTHLSRLRNHRHELHMALINQGTTVNVLPATTEQYTLLDKIYVALKFRKQIRQEKKVAKAEMKAEKKRAKLEAKIEKLRGKM